MMKLFVMSPEVHFYGLIGYTSLNNVSLVHVFFILAIDEVVLEKYLYCKFSHMRGKAMFVLLPLY